MKNTYGDIYLGKDGFLLKLDEVDKFIRQYQSLRGTSASPSSLGDQLHRGADTVRWGFDGSKKAEGLSQALSIHIQTMILFFVAQGL